MAILENTPVQNATPLDKVKRMNHQDGWWSIADLPFLSIDTWIWVSAVWKTQVQIKYGDFPFNPVSKEHGRNVHMTQRISSLAASKAWDILDGNVYQEWKNT